MTDHERGAHASEQGESGYLYPGTIAHAREERAMYSDRLWDFVDRWWKRKVRAGEKVTWELDGYLNAKSALGMRDARL